MLKQHQEILEKHPKCQNKIQKAYTQIAPVHRDGFYTNPDNHPSLPWDPNPPATTKREVIQKIRFL